MKSKRNNQHPNTSNQIQTNTTIESYQYPIIPPIRIGISNQNGNPLNNKSRPNSNRNNYDEKNRLRNIGCKSNKPSIQSPIKNESSNLPRLNNLTNPMMQTSSRCNQQQSCSDNPLNINSNKLNQSPFANNLNPQSMEIKEPIYPKFYSPRRRKNYNRTRNMGNQTNQNHTKNICTSNKSSYTNAEEDPWDDYTIDGNDIIEKQSCAICLCDFEIDEKAIKLNCGHIFHKCCIIPWYDENIKSPTCPICRKNLLNSNSSHNLVILREAKSLLTDADSLLTDIKSWLIEANSFLKQENLNTTRSLQKLKEYEEKIASYLKLIKSYHERISFYSDRLQLIDKPLNLTETENDSLSSLIKSLLKRLNSISTKLRSICIEIETFQINTKNMMNSTKSANLSEEKSNLNESNENNSSLFETHESSRCCILI